MECSEGDNQSARAVQRLREPQLAGIMIEPLISGDGEASERRKPACSTRARCAAAALCRLCLHWRRPLTAFCRLLSITVRPARSLKKV